MSKTNQLYSYHHNDFETLKKVVPLYNMAVNNGFKIAQNPSSADLIISIGNDGTFLQAVRKTDFKQDCLYAGISTNENLNMYCDFRLDEISKMFSALTNEKIEYRKYPIIE